MALGFAITNITDSKILPDRTLSRESTPLVKVANFGDGYQQRVADGLNSLGEIFQVTFNNREKSIADDIVDFFAASKGVTSFGFTYPDTNSTTTVAASVNGSVTNSASVTLDTAAVNLNISAGATITGVGWKVSDILITNAGSGYSSAPTIAFSGGGGSNAAATAVTAVTVGSMSGRTALTLNTTQTIADDANLTFTNPNEREVKVVCSTWSQTYTDLLSSTITATFDRVYEP